MSAEMIIRDNLSLPDIDECQSNPCRNSGICVDEANGHKCECLSGYTGPICDTGKCILSVLKHYE